MYLFVYEDRHSQRTVRVVLIDLRGWSFLVEDDLTENARLEVQDKKVI